MRDICRLSIQTIKIRLKSLIAMTFGPGDRQSSMDAARAIIDANRYMTLATADADGVPWASPVWFAPDGERDMLWISRPDTQHSRNLAVRPELSIVIFDSQRVPGDTAALYLSATAAVDQSRAEVYSAYSVAQGLPPYPEHPADAAEFHLYRAHVRERWLLGPSSVRVPAPFST
jgi:general stress protein 26